jgi:hypothetical protein
MASMARRDVPLANNPKDALDVFLIDIHDIYYVWYEKSVNRHNRLWLPITWFGLFSGFATSIIAALATEESFKHFTIIRILLVVLPALGSALISISVQSGLQERYQLREMGRRGVQKLWNEGRASYAEATTPEQYSSIYRDLAARLDQIEKQQAIGFFSIAAASVSKKSKTAP